MEMPLQAVGEARLGEAGSCVLAGLNNRALRKEPGSERAMGRQGQRVQLNSMACCECRAPWAHRPPHVPPKFLTELL